MTADRTLTCADCGQEFVFTASEQQFYADRGFSIRDGVRTAACAQGAAAGQRRRRRLLAARATARAAGAATEAAVKRRWWLSRASATRDVRGDVLQLRQDGERAVPADERQARLLRRLLQQAEDVTGRRTAKPDVAPNQRAAIQPHISQSGENRPPAVDHAQYVRAPPESDRVCRGRCHCRVAAGDDAGGRGQHGQDGRVTSTPTRRSHHADLSTTVTHRARRRGDRGHPRRSSGLRRPSFRTPMRPADRRRSGRPLRPASLSATTPRPTPTSRSCRPRRSSGRSITPAR